ncbi:MAG: hypothetical protein QM613_03700 [Micrococcaceae bacterium]
MRRISKEVWQHIRERHPEITKQSINESLNDPAALIYDPWKANISGKAYASIGFSESIKKVVLVALSKETYEVLTAWTVTKGSRYWNDYFKRR